VHENVIAYVEGLAEDPLPVAGKLSTRLAGSIVPVSRLKGGRRRPDLS
jgi:hypothetical protein